MTTPAALDLYRALVGKWRREAYALEAAEMVRPIAIPRPFGVHEREAAALERCATELEAIVTLGL